MSIKRDNDMRTRKGRIREMRRRQAILNDQLYVEYLFDADGPGTCHINCPVKVLGRLRCGKRLVIEYKGIEDVVRASDVTNSPEPQFTVPRALKGPFASDDDYTEAHAWFHERYPHYRRLRRSRVEVADVYDFKLID